jgi:hypothetical protein
MVRNAVGPFALANTKFEPFSLASIVKDINKKNSILYILNYDSDNIIVLNEIITASLSDKITPFDISTSKRSVSPIKDKVLWIHSKGLLTWQQAEDIIPLLLKLISKQSVTVLLSHNISYPCLNWLYWNTEFSAIKQPDKTMIFPDRMDYIQRIQRIIFRCSQSKAYDEKRLDSIVLPTLYSKIANEGKLEIDCTQQLNWYQILFSETGLKKYERIKIDSIYKIKKEKHNYDMVVSNYLLKNILYYISGIAEFKEEFIGALSSLPASASSVHRHHFNDLKTFKQILKEESPAEFEEYYDTLNNHMNMLYNMPHKNLSQNNTFASYVQKIFGRFMDLKISNINNISIPPAQKELLYECTIKEALKKNEKIESGAIKAKIIEINPINRYMSLQLEENEQKIKIIIRLHLNLDIELCKQHFHQLDIKENGYVFVVGIQTDSELHQGVQGIGFMIKIEEQIETIRNNFNKPSERDDKSYRDKEWIRIKQGKPINPMPLADDSDAQSEEDDEKHDTEKHNIINSEYIVLKNKEIYNPLYLLDQYLREEKNLDKDIFGLAHGDLNLENIIVSGNPDTTDNKKGFEMRFIDIAALDFDYPLSFDYVKLETEMKTHILALKLSTESDDNKIDTIKEFEYMLMLNKRLDQNSLNNNNDLKAFYNLILKIRKDAYKRYDNTMNPTKLYRQQLLFYNLKALTYRRLSMEARLWTLISASMCAEILGTGKINISRN